MGINCMDDFEFDLDKWAPTESDKQRIAKILYENYIGTLENCSLGVESQEAFELYDKVNFNDIAETKEDIQEFFIDTFCCVGGELDKYYNDQELIDLINLTVCPHPSHPNRTSMKGR